MSVIPNNNLYFDKWDKKTTKQEYIRKKVYLMINSKDRDLASFPEPQSYVINLPTVFKNVESVRLVSGTIPDLNNVKDEPFLVLDVPELNNAYTKFHTSSNNYDLFDIIRFSDNVTISRFFYIQPGVNNLYKPILAKLSRLSINIRDQFGNLFTFGDDNDIEPVNMQLQNTFVFEITTLEANTYKLGERNVY